MIARFAAAIAMGAAVTCGLLLTMQLLISMEDAGAVTRARYEFDNFVRVQREQVVEAKEAKPVRPTELTPNPQGPWPI